MMGRYYVYDLIDPRDGQTFYVGKGCGNRLFAHERSAMRGDRSAKSERIRSIKDDGLQVLAVVVKRFDNEAEAYAFEARRISELGRVNLLNIREGGFGGRYRSDADLALEAAEALLSAYSQWAARGKVSSVSLGRHGVLDLRKIAASWLEEIARLAGICGVSRLEKLAVSKDVQIVWK